MPSRSGGEMGAPQRGPRDGRRGCCSSAAGAGAVEIDGRRGAALLFWRASRANNRRL